MTEKENDSICNLFPYQPSIEVHNPDKSNEESLPNESTLEPEETYRTEKEFRKKIGEYRSQLKNLIVTTRFTNDTLAENESFRQKNTKVGCVYCSPTPISRVIAEDMTLFVLEMNNSTNKISGIGVVKNRAICNKYKVYYNVTYNRYVYMGKNRISRESMTEEEEEMMRVFDAVCFKGKYHMKRGNGITTFPMEVLYRCSAKVDLVEFVRQMFMRRAPKTIDNQKI
jgi:hypothetical protein